MTYETQTSLSLTEGGPVTHKERAALARASQWTEAMDAEMRQEGMSSEEQVRHWKMLILIAQATLQEYEWRDRQARPEA